MVGESICELVEPVHENGGAKVMSIIAKSVGFNQVMLFDKVCDDELQE